MKTLSVKVLATVVLAGAFVAVCSAQSQGPIVPHRKPQVPPIPTYQPQPNFQPIPYQQQPPAFQPMPAYQPPLYQVPGQIAYQPPMSQYCVAGQLVGILSQFFPVGTQCTVTDQYQNVWQGSVQFVQ